MTIRIEAENLSRSTFGVETISGASGGRVASLIGGSLNQSGLLTTQLNDISTGLYDIYIGYYDETDGVGNIQVSVGSSPMADFRLDQNTGSAGPDFQSFRRRLLASDFQIAQGQLLEIAAQEQQYEYARIDYIEFVPKGGSAPPPTSIPDRGLVSIGGEARQWHRIDLNVTAPFTVSETGSDNPFLNYRLDVTFTKGGKSYTVPGYFAADGKAGNSGSASGNRWITHFSPDEPGTWNYSVRFSQGTNVAIDGGGTPIPLQNSTGSFNVGISNKTGQDWRSKGRLTIDPSGRYYRHQGTGEIFLKGGTNSPEDLLAQSGTSYLENSIQYLASEGVNSAYLMTYNIDGGDGRNVHPWIGGGGDKTRFDVSKLAQWQATMEQLNANGIMAHIVTQETENDEVIDGGRLGDLRRLYYRELIARFGYLNGLQWNLGEEFNLENDIPNEVATAKSFIDHIRSLDPYDHPITVHTPAFLGRQETLTNALIGYPGFTGTSIQVTDNDNNTAHLRTRYFRDRAGSRPLVVSIDEIFDNNRNPQKSETMDDIYGVYFAGGAGIEHYFGGRDLGQLRFSDYDWLWDWTRNARSFVQTYLPFTQMQSDNGATSRSNDVVFSKPGDVYAIYLPGGGTTNINLPSGNYDVKWFDPYSGGELLNGSVTSLSGGGNRSIGTAPYSSSTQNWVALVVD